MPTFLMGGLLFGALAGAIPIVIHLICREKPRHLMFPAVRFILQSVRVSAARSRLKHLLLLALRILAIVLLAVALAGPMTQGSSIGGEGVDRIIIIDDAYTMGYMDRKKTRFDQAKEQIEAALEELPQGSRVSLFAASGSPPPFDTPEEALKQREDLVLSDRIVDLADALTRAGQLLKSDGKNNRRDIVVFTDRVGVWGAKGPADVGDDVTVHIRDLGQTKDENLYLKQFVARPTRTPANPARPFAPAAAEAKYDLSVVLYPSEHSAIQGVEVSLFIEGTRRSAHPVDTIDKGGTEIRFQGEPIPTDRPVSGSIRIKSADPRGIKSADSLKRDDVIHFTLMHLTRQRVLIVAPGGEAHDGARAVRKTLDPTLRTDKPESSKRWPVEAHLIDPADPMPGRLDEFHSVILVDLPTLPKKTDDAKQLSWESLTAFVKEGGGLITFLGPAGDREAYARDGKDCLPVTKIDPPGPTRSGQSVSAQMDVPSSALFAKIDGRVTGLDVREPAFRTACPVTLAPDARVLASFGEEEPIPWIVERDIGQGRSVLLTSSWGADWNELFSVKHGYTLLRFLLHHELVRFVQASDRLQYGLDEGVPIKGDYNAALGGVMHPHGSSDRVVFKGPVYADTSRAGLYRVTDSAPGTRAKTLYQFSVNLDPIDSALVRQSDAELEVAFAPEAWKRVRFAESDDQLQANIAETLDDLALFPWFMLALLMIISVESFFANRFHRR